ncbi:CDP-alcohol phosphatidyltransferase family protein [Sphingomonas alba]|uniref:CDP-alcohol phosphatidyltransferase family protein n=1 Tax=Sphingomonas alba TaxID=2908208 RepID=A0ABT0RLW1_9SPHN|nr:CDP-alcohol phosphatidyltransferase family protein [Sphingomonas alba]MCL6683590.1 CDP-alcohol phosphatidyltransferase family protein [Sphingomonas alba]
MASEPVRTDFLLVPVGENPARVFGLDAETRVERLAEKAGMDCSREVDPSRPVILSDLGFAWDPVWLTAIKHHPNNVLMIGDRAVLAHVPAGQDSSPVQRAMESASPWTGTGLDKIDAETAELSYSELRKRDRPFVLPLDPADPEPVERAAYDASYKGVTDILTLYLWRRPAFYLTRWAAQAGMTPNQVTLIGAILCIATFFLWMEGLYWSGVATAFGFMVLDTVDGKLARCTGQSSKWGNIFDHGLDLVHPPFWWWAWANGLNSRADPFEPVYEWLIICAIVGGYVVQRVIEGIFMRKYGMHIHVWRKIDSKFRLITARRNPNMVILVFSLIRGKPDTGLELVALWTIVSLIFHAVRLAQANALTERGGKVVSWLS